MRRNISFLLVLLFMGAAQVSAQQIAVYSNDGGKVKHGEANCELSKITFSNGQMSVHYDGKVTAIYNVKDILRIEFYDYDSSSVESMRGEQGIKYHSKSNELIVRAAPGTAIKVYRACGGCVLSRVQTIAAPAINLAHLPAGAYIAVAGSETLKFVKQ